jgi:Nop53 (60S ribosomal biogenesis)
VIVDLLVGKMPILMPPVASQEGPQQYKQPSRKGKRAWRKNVDISEIQEGLENVWDEITKGYRDLYLIMPPLAKVVVVELSPRRNPQIYLPWTPMATLISQKSS